MDLKFSFIVPVFNRPQEIFELLESFCSLNFSETYEIVLVEDGSTQTAEAAISKYLEILPISYYYKENTGPGDSRNFGMQKATGNYFIILDSDVLITPDYLTTVNEFLSKSYFDCYGGADAAHHTFTPLQKAINYVMTSFITTGGIRGSEHSVSKFEPRSFNMGISKEAFIKTGGFSKIHPGEDPDLSWRIVKAGFKTTFIPNAVVFHKRRISWNLFFIQVNKFGKVRPILNSWHPEGAKITFWFPTLFMGFVFLSIVLALTFSYLYLLPVMLYLLAVLVGAALKTKNVLVGLLAVVALLIQFTGYGLGFLKSTILIGWLQKNPEVIFPKLFFR